MLPESFGQLPAQACAWILSLPLDAPVVLATVGPHTASWVLFSQDTVSCERPQTCRAATLSHPLWFRLQSNYPAEQLCNSQVTSTHPANGRWQTHGEQNPESQKLMSLNP